MIVYCNQKLCKYYCMKWAAEHPEPVYPTWCEWLVTQGVIGGTKEIGHFVKDKIFKPIPADIAHKLGIEPKEGA